MPDVSENLQHEGAFIRAEEFEALYKGKRPRILSGMRPTGKLHLGHLAGALESWVALQDKAQNFHLIADYHVLTTSRDSSKITENSVEMAADWIAFGIDPNRSPIFRQSKVKEHAELFLIFSMLVTKARLERNPAVKEQVRDLGIGEGLTYGHLGYPVLQAADILLYRGELVPVGEDQIPHVEITREFARDFNYLYGNVFPVPKAFVSTHPRLPGTDGKRMSKSVGNTILLSDTPDETWVKMKSAVTDPLKVRKGDPGRPEVCLVYTYHEKWNPAETKEIYAGCTTGALGCVDCKKRITEKINEARAPGREKRAELAAKPEQIMLTLERGEEQPHTEAEKTMSEVRNAMKFG
ncbi:MAG TPA: tryptophan--tRNA ligase [Steroidobacteraceae bacterium]|nr:tryptophan--tRNA ligase [Steroidobacteraceae bacterium]